MGRAQAGLQEAAGGRGLVPCGWAPQKRARTPQLCSAPGWMGARCPAASPGLGRPEKPPRRAKGRPDESW